jgi:hypothetical protein
MVERGPEKAGVGGSIPSLGTFYFQLLRCSTLYSKGALLLILAHFCTFVIVGLHIVCKALSVK